MHDHADHPLRHGTRWPPPAALPAPSAHPAGVFSTTAPGRRGERRCPDPLAVLFALAVHSAIAGALMLGTGGTTSFEPPQALLPWVAAPASRGGEIRAAEIPDETAPAPAVEARPLAASEALLHRVVEDIESVEVTATEARLLDPLFDVEPEALPPVTRPERRFRAPLLRPIPGLRSERAAARGAEAPAGPRAAAAAPPASGSGIPPAVAAPGTMPSPLSAAGPPAKAGSGAGHAGAGAFVGASPRTGWQVKPPYPREARRRSLEGVAVVEMEVDDTGRVARVRLVQSSGHACLDEAALEAAREWRFIPARQDGIPVPATVRRRFAFHLEG